MVHSPHRPTRDVAVPLGGSTPPRDPQEAGVLDETANREWARVVRAAVAGLDDAARRALTLVYFRGFSQAGAAARLGVSQRTLRRHLSRGLRQLASIIVAESRE